jgi:uncharacterized protein YjbI with pentapeptide repeats
MSSKSQLESLRCRSFRSANLRQADFSGIDLSGADFTDAILDGANFSHADLRGTVFRRSSLVGANLSYIRSGIHPHRVVLFQAILLILAVLLGLLAGFVGSSATGLLTDESKVFMPYHDIQFPISWHTMSGLLAISYGILVSFILRLKNPVTAMTIGVGSIIIIDAIVVGSIIYACKLAVQPWDVVGYMAIAIGGSAMLVIFQGIFTTTCLAIVVSILNSNRHVLIATVVGAAIALSSTINVDSSRYIQLGTIIGAGSIIYISFQIGIRNEVNQQKYYSIATIASYISSYYGTCFDRANLTDANLEYAILNNSNLSGANLTHTNIFGVHQLDFARFDRTILTDPLVRDLLVCLRGRGCDYTGCDLHGAYLVAADLSSADFTGADLSNADLSDARLDGANLTRVLAINTNFQSAIFTGACIADWSIDRSTKLNDIICDYIYLKSPGEERNPASGNFTVGQFTRLFHEVWNTVDLIFDRGIDWTSFGHAWQQIQIENEGVPLTIQGIERKGGGTILVKVEVPLDLDKTRLHEDFNLAYNLAVQSLEDRHRVELAGRESLIERLHQREIAIYQEQQNQLNHILQSLVHPKAIGSTSEQLVLIKIGARNQIDLDVTKEQNSNLSVIVEIGDRGEFPRAAAAGGLGDRSAVISAYHDWQISYRKQLKSGTRIDISEDQITHIEQILLPIDRDLDEIDTCKIAAKNLKCILNRWLDRSDFKPIKELMLQELHPSQSIQVVIQTDELYLRQLPFQLWNFFDRFIHAEISIASNTYQSIAKEQLRHSDLNILAIFGNSTGLDLQVDRHSLATLPNATVEFLVEPTRQILTDKLWERPWDVIFFGGHSASDPSLKTGYLRINQLDRLDISELKYTLKRSIESGLKLVILNSCDSLGLATGLISSQLPQAIVMRESVPDFVAQQFLKNFLTAFASGLPLYRAVRTAREQLEGLEDKYPCASWLPIICQNPAEIACRS